MFQDSCLLTLSPDFWNIVFFVFFLVFLVFSRFFGFLHFYFCKSPGILFFLIFWCFLVFSRFFGFLLLQESWNIFFGFLEVFCFFWHSQTTGANANKTCKEVGFFLGGYHIYFRPWLSRPNFGRNKTDLQQFFDSVQISFHFDKCSFFTVFSMVSVLCIFLL